MLFSDKADFLGALILSFIAVGFTGSMTVCSVFVEATVLLFSSSEDSRGEEVGVLFVVFFSVLKKSGLIILAEPFFFHREQELKLVALSTIQLIIVDFY